MPPLAVPLPDARRSELPGTYRWKEGEEVLVATQGAGVRLEARGGNVGNVLAGGRVADFRADVTSATEIVEAVRKGDAALVASRLLSGIPQSWPETLIQRIWPAHLAKWGNLRGVRTLGAQALAPGRTEVLLGLSHEHGEACVRVVLQRGKLNIFDLEAGCSAASRVYVPVSEEEFASFAWQDPQPPRVRFERAKGGGAAALIVASARDDVRMPRVP
jgi:hypothetical protein